MQMEREERERRIREEQAMAASPAARQDSLRIIEDATGFGASGENPAASGGKTLKKSGKKKTLKKSGKKKTLKKSGKKKTLKKSAKKKTIRHKKGGVASVPLERASMNNHKKCMDDCMEKKRRKINRLIYEDGRRTYHSVLNNYYDKHGVRSDNASCRKKCDTDLHKQRTIINTLKKYNRMPKTKQQKLSLNKNIDEQMEMNRTKEQFNKYKDKLSSLLPKKISPKPTNKLWTPSGWAHHTHTHVPVPIDHQTESIWNLPFTKEYTAHLKSQKKQRTEKYLPTNTPPPFSFGKRE
jgi:hypothetical protein